MKIENLELALQLKKKLATLENLRKEVLKSGGKRISIKIQVGNTTEMGLLETISDDFNWCMEMINKADEETKADLRTLGVVL